MKIFKTLRELIEEARDADLDPDQVLIDEDGVFESDDPDNTDDQD